MVKPSNPTARSTSSGILNAEYFSIQRRLDLVYRYKKHCDPASNISREQIDFVNGMLSPYKMNALTCAYESAIDEVVVAQERSAREKFLRQLRRER